MSKGTKTASIFGGLALVMTLAACGGSADANDDSGSARVDVPKSLVGTWYQTNKVGGIIMQAEVHRGGTIQINLKTRDSSSIYWMGSFESYKNPRFNFETVSKADPDAQKVLEGSVFGSQDTSKKFTYNRGDLSFKFTMTGTTSTIHLRKPYKSTNRKPTTTPPTASNPKAKQPSKTSTTPKPAAPKAPAPKAPSISKTKK